MREKDSLGLYKNQEEVTGLVTTAYKENKRTDKQVAGFLYKLYKPTTLNKKGKEKHILSECMGHFFKDFQWKKMFLEQMV